MASPAEVTKGLPDTLDQVLPDTLPEDFSEWDGESSPAVAPGSSNGSEVTRSGHQAPVSPEKSASLGANAAGADGKQVRQMPVFLKQQKPTGQTPNRGALWVESAPAKSKAAETPADEKSLNARSVASVPVFVKKQESGNAQKSVEQNADTKAKVPALDKAQNAQASVSSPAKRQDSASASTAQAVDAETTRDAFEFKGFGGIEAEESFVHSLKSKLGDGKKKWMIIGAASCTALLLIVVAYFKFGPGSLAKQSVQPVSASTSSQFTSNLPQQSPLEATSQVKPSPATGMDGSTATPEVDEEEAPAAPKVQSRMMNEQLNAPTRITKDIKNQFAENAPPPSGFGVAADALGAGGANSSVFSGGSQPVIKSARPLAISAGVATGMLVQKTAPVYPAIAKQARVSGTVVLQATISKSGAITNLTVVSGPPMLRQSAVDAVRTWRYKPYKLNNEPTDVETTVNVVFSLQ